MANWTQAEIDALREALKTGARKVKYEDREVEYQSLREIQRVIEQAERECGLAPKGRRFSLSSSNKGLGS